MLFHWCQWNLIIFTSTWDLGWRLGPSKGQCNFCHCHQWGQDFTLSFQIKSTLRLGFSKEPKGVSCPIPNDFQKELGPQLISDPLKMSYLIANIATAWSFHGWPWGWPEASMWEGQLVAHTVSCILQKTEGRECHTPVFVLALVQFWIHFKVLVLIIKVLNVLGPGYLRNCLRGSPQKNMLYMDIISDAVRVKLSWNQNGQ